MEKHLEMLEKYPELKGLYEVFSRMIKANS
jgi:hypothetical protein